MYRNIIKKHLSESTAPAIKLANKLKKDNDKINKDGVKAIAKDLKQYEEEPKADENQKEMAPNKYNYTEDNQKTYHDEMEIMNGQEMITYSIEPTERFTERAIEAIAGSSKMGNNPEWANVVAKGQGGDPEFGKNLVKKIKSSIKKRKDAEKDWFALGDDIEFDPKVNKNFKGKPHAFEGVEAKKTINEGVDSDYTHFLVSKSDNKIIDGFDYSDMEPDEVRHYLKLDIIDKGLNPKEYKLVSASYLERNGINPFDESNWKNQGEESPEDPMTGLDTDYERDSRSQQYGIDPYQDINESDKNKNKIKTQIKESMKRLKFKTEFNGVGNALKLIPESYKVDNKVFEMTDGNESYKIRWEGSVNEGKAVVLIASDKNLVNEDIQRMKNLFSYKSQDTLGNLKGNSRIDENKTFSDIWSKTKSLLEMEDIEGTDGETGDWDDAVTSQAADAKKHVQGSTSSDKGTQAPKSKTGNWDDVKKSAPEATKHVQGSASTDKGTKAPKSKTGQWDDAITSQSAEAKKHITSESVEEGAISFMDVAAPATAFASVVAPFIYTYLKGSKAKMAAAKAAKGAELSDDEIKAIKDELSSEMASGIERSTGA
jgi:hypothetical protein